MRQLGSLRFGKRFSKPGTAPGTLTAPTDQRVEEVSIRVMTYGPAGYDERKVARVEEALPDGGRAEAEDEVVWIDVVGLHDVETVRTIGEHFGLHPLALEDVLNTGQRPKAEDYEDHDFLIMRLFHPVEQNTSDPRAAGVGSVESEQISIFLGVGFVVTFQEILADVFEPVRERIRHGKGRIRRMGSDYLAYALLDSLVDHFFPVLERLGDRLEILEDEVMVEPARDTVERIHRLKKELLLLRRAAWPQREVLSALERFESERIGSETRIFLRDAYDHAVQIMDIVETYRDLASGLLDIYLSSVSNRMNEVMKVLTVMASIFIPITFIAGVYGMNFEHMPELGKPWAYPVFWGVTLSVVAGLLWFFRRRGWI